METPGPTSGVIIGFVPSPFMKPNIIIRINGISLHIVATVWIVPDVLELMVFKILISKIVPKVMGTTRDSLPISIALWLPNITARAAIVAGKNKTHCIQPVNTPSFFP